ncbi:MAG: RNA-binding cell elongation regulator Jag/EloR [Bacillota bacterium]
MDKIKKSGKTVDEAIQLALEELQLTIEEVEVHVIEEGTKGLFGFLGGKEALVEVEVKLTPKDIAEKFLREVFLTMNFEVKLEAEQKEKQLYINLIGENMGILIGKRGQTLDSLQYLVNLVVNKNTTTYMGVTLDTENYRQRRKETLTSLAYNLGKKVRNTKKDVVLEPMSAYERRIIHSTLQNDNHVKTYSKGEDPHRHIVITLK